MAKKQIKKLTITRVYAWSCNWDGNLDSIPEKNKTTIQILGIELPNGSYYLENGEIVEDKATCQIQASRTRNVPSEVRANMEHAYELIMKKKSLEKEKETISHEISEIAKQLEEIPSLITTAKGFLPYQLFVEEFKKALPSYILSEIKEYGYNFSSSYYGNGQVKDIKILRDKDIQKYFRNGSFVYEEYDGTIHMISDCEKDPEYKKYIRRSRKPLSVNQKPDEWLGLGDKDWLTYHAVYSIPIKKPMTQSYACQLAELFSKNKQKGE